MVGIILTLFVTVVAVWIVSKLPGGCQKDCSQGRRCDCGHTHKDM